MTTTDTDLDAQLEFTAAAVRDAGELALDHHRRGVKSWRKADGSEVSDADMAVNALLEERLRGETPDYGWLSEETADSARRLGTHRVWIVDPIDGTQAFLSGGTDWCVAVALVEAGTPVLAAVYNAARDEFFTALRGRGATLNGDRLQPKPLKPNKPFRVIAPRSLLKLAHWHEPLPPHKPVWAASMIYRLALVGSGRAEAALAFSPKWEWDVAAGTLIAQEAGRTVSDMHGRKLTFNTNEARVPGFIAASPDLHAMLLERKKS